MSKVVVNILMKKHTKEELAALLCESRARAAEGFKELSESADTQLELLLRAREARDKARDEARDLCKLLSRLRNDSLEYRDFAIDALANMDALVRAERVLTVTLKLAMAVEMKPLVFHED